MVAQLVEHERIETTLPKAKELRRLADRAVTLAKAGDLAARRAALPLVQGSKETVSKLFGPLAERYAEREGGYCRVLRSRQRLGDGAEMAVVEFVDRPGELRPARPAGGGSSRGGGGGGEEDAAAFLPAAAKAALRSGAPGSEE